MFLTSLADRFSAVLFDFDGTLAPNLDLPGMRRDVVAMTKAFGVPDAVFADRYIIEVIDAGADYLRTRNSAQAEDYFHQAHQLILDIELGAAAVTQPFPRTDELLLGLRKLGVRTGIVTRNCQAAVRLSYPALVDHTDVVVTRDDTDHVKPDPRHLLEALSQLGSTPEKSIMVGDGALDMKTGASLAMYCVGVLSGSGDAAALLDAGADVVLEDCFSLAP